MGRDQFDLKELHFGEKMGNSSSTRDCMEFQCWDFSFVFALSENARAKNLSHVIFTSFFRETEMC